MSYSARDGSRFAKLVGFLSLVLVIATISSTTFAQAITLEVMHRWSQDRHPLLRQILDRFEEMHPGVKVVDYEVGEMLHEKLMTAWLGAAGPDVAMVNLRSSAVYGDGGFLLPLDPFVEAENLTFYDLIYPGIADSIVWNGQTYYLPLTINVGRHLMYYNRSMFAEQGLDPDRPPVNHTEWFEAARRLTRLDADGTPIKRGIDFVTNNNERNYRLSETLTEQWGTGFFDPLGQSVLMDVDRAASVMEWMLDFNRQTSNIIATGGQGRSHFQNETVGMYMGIDGDWFIFDDGTLSFDMGLAPLPAPDGEPLRTVVTAGWGWGISRQTQYPELAWELVKWLSIAPEGGGWFIQQQGRMSSNPEFNLDPTYLDIHPYWHVLAEVANSGLPGPQMCLNVQTSEAHSLIGGALLRAARGEGDPRSHLMEAKRVLEPKCRVQ